jgi:hypothetical protein
MEALFSLTGALEAVTGLGLLVAPSALVALLLGAPLYTPAGITVSRVAGVALLALGVACWFARNDTAGRASKGLLAAMLLYNMAVVAILVLAWGSLGLAGLALWPVVLAHTPLAAWCIAHLMRTPERNGFRPP